MKKLLAFLAALCLLCAAALAEEPVFTFRSGVTFGLNMDQVMEAETVPYHEIDNERTKGPVSFAELEYEDVTENGMKADLKYLFVGNELVAIQVSYDTEDRGISYEAVRDALEKAYGPSAALDAAALGNGIYAVDDEGRPEGQTEAWASGAVMIILVRDDDDVDVTYVDLSAAYIHA